MTTKAHDPKEAPGLADDALEEARSLIGVELRRQDHYWNTEASPDAVRHFCWGIGDENPLFCDPRVRRVDALEDGLAPGCFLFTIDSTVVAPKLRGIQWIYSGVDWQWYKPIRHRDRFTTKVQLIDAVEKIGKQCEALHRANRRIALLQPGRRARLPRQRQHCAHSPRARQGRPQVPAARDAQLHRGGAHRHSRCDRSRGTRADRTRDSGRT